MVWYILLYTFIIITGCTNEFITVDIDSTTSTLTCLFQNKQNTVEKTCSVEYSLCNQDTVFTSEGNSTVEFPDRVVLKINLPSGSDCYMYTVHANDSTNTVMVEGSVDPGK